MIAFHGKPGIKSKFMRRLNQHHKLDEIVRGQYWENGKGCAVGCTLHSSQHKEYEVQLGIPIQLAKLEDEIFESLENGASKDFAVDFLKSIKVGADLSKVHPAFMSWCLEYILLYPRKKELPIYIKESIELVRNLLNKEAAGENVEVSVWLDAQKETQKVRQKAAAAYAAADAAYAADAAAAYAAATAAYAAATAAYDADDAAAYVATAAYDAADDAAAYVDADVAAYAYARKKFWTSAAAQLIKLLKTEGE